jgi:hypothetical protein
MGAFSPLRMMIIVALSAVLAFATSLAQAQQPVWLGNAPSGFLYSAANGAVSVSSSNVISPEFQWIRPGVAGGFYAIKNVATGMYLQTIYVNWVVQQPYTGARNQLWQDFNTNTKLTIPLTKTSYEQRLLINAENGLCLTKTWIIPFVNSVIVQNCGSPPYQSNQLWWAYPYW